MLFSSLLAWVLGTAVQLQQQALWSVRVCAVLAAASLWVLVYSARRPTPCTLRACTCGLAVALMAFSLTALRSHAFLSNRLNPALEGRDVVVTGVVVGLPQRTEQGLRFRLEVSSAQWQGQAVVVPDRVDVGWYGGVYSLGNEQVGLQRLPADVRAGERWRMLLRLKAPHGSSNPYGFDYELWLWEQGVAATAYVRAGPGDPEPQCLEQTWTAPVDLARQELRDRIFRKVEPPQVAGLVAALVVGDQRAIDRPDWDVFRATGVAHLMSISGLHITMFAWCASLATGWAWRRSRWLCMAVPAPSAALLGGVLLALAYAVFSGWGVPAQRTCLMLAAVALLRLLGARWPWPQVWMLACAVVVAFDPWALLQAGFWLSFVAVGVLIAGGAPNAPHAEAAPVAPTLSDRAWQLMREQWTISLALAPLTLLFFGQVSLVGLLANLFAIPWVTLVVTPLAMLGVAVPELWGLAAGAINLLMACLQALAALPLASVSLAIAPWWAGLLGTLGAWVLVAPLPWQLRGMGVPLLLPVLLWQAPLPATGHFEILAADVGQGNAVLVRTAGHALLYDAGPRYGLESDAGHRVLLPLLQALQSRLDLLVLSHRDADHVGGAAAVLAMQPQARLLSSISPDHPLQGLRPAQRCESGQAWVWDGVQFDVLHPLAGDYTSQHAAEARPNTLSCVLRITNGAHTVLLVGDIEAAQEAALLSRAAPLRADVLLVPHHGSKTSSTSAFLDAVQPRFALIQSGYRNRYGHPAASVAQRYADQQIVVRDSPHCGAMRWTSNQPQRLECTRMMQERYWSHQVP